jgi:hypothetical protein
MTILSHMNKSCVLNPQLKAKIKEGECGKQQGERPQDIGDG